MTEQYWLMPFYVLEDWKGKGDWLDWAVSVGADKEKECDWVVVRASSENEAMSRWQNKMRKRGLDPTGEAGEPMDGAPGAYLQCDPIPLGAERPSDAECVRIGNAALRKFYSTPMVEPVDKPADLGDL
jgi:hypothetical protein